MRRGTERQKAKLLDRVEGFKIFEEEGDSLRGCGNEQITHPGQSGWRTATPVWMADYPDRRMGEEGSRVVTSIRARLLQGNRRLRVSAREMIVFKVEPEPCGAFNSPLIRWQLEGIPEEQIGKATLQQELLNLNRFNFCLQLSVLEELLTVCCLLFLCFFILFLGPGGKNTSCSTGWLELDKSVAEDVHLKPDFSLDGILHGSPWSFLVTLSYFRIIEANQKPKTREKIQVSNRWQRKSCLTGLFPVLEVCYYLIWGYLYCTSLCCHMYLWLQMKCFTVQARTFAGVDIHPKVVSCGNNGGNLTGQMLLGNRFLTSFPATPLGAQREREEKTEGENRKSLPAERDWFDLTHLPPCPDSDWMQQMLVEAESRDDRGEVKWQLHTVRPRQPLFGKVGEKTGKRVFNYWSWRVVMERRRKRRRWSADLLKH